MNLTLIAGSMADSIKTWFQGILGALLSIFPKLIYQITAALFTIIDALQWLLRKFAGLDTIAQFGNQTDVKNDLVLQFFNMIFSGSSPVLTNIFWSMIILGVLMLIITTMIAVVRSEYTATDSKSASKGKIIGNSLKALASFAIVPIVCFFGIYLSNVILQALDKVTTGTTTTNTQLTNKFQSETTSSGETTYNNYSFFGFEVPTSSTPISGMIFKAAAYSANRARSQTQYSYKGQNGQEIKGTFHDIMLENGKISAGEALLVSTDAQKYEQNALFIDDAFANCYNLQKVNYIDPEPFKSSFMYPFNGSVFGMAAEQIAITVGYTHFDKNNVALVWYYYDLWSFDFIIAIGSAVIVATLLLYLVFGLIKRIFELVILFLVAAPITSIMPLDGGAALKKWREKFISKTIGVYGPIVGLNLFFVVLTILQTVQLTGIAIIDKLVSLLFTIAGLAMVKDFTKMLSELIGGEDAMAAGADKAKEIGATAVKVGKVAAGVGGLAMMPTKLGAKAVGKTVDKVSGGKLTAFKGKVNNKIKDINEAGGLKNYLADKRLNKQAEKGKGRYKKGSRSYNKAKNKYVEAHSNEQAMADTYFNRHNWAIKAELEDEKNRKILNKYARIYNTDDVDELMKNDNFRKRYFNDNANETYKEEIKSDVNKHAAMNFDGYEEYDVTKKEWVHKGLSNDDRKYLIDKSRVKNLDKREAIQTRAIENAGGEEKWSKLNAKEKNKLFNSANRAIKDEDAKKTGGKISEGFMEGLKDLGKHIAVFAEQTSENMFGAIKENLKGLSDIPAIAQGKLKKEIGLNAEIKNQKKLAAAQAAATESRGMGKDNRKQDEAPQKTELSSDSINKLANAISNKKNAQTTLKIDDSSIDKLSNSIASKINKKED